jgi:hypothetical protein
MPIFNFLNRLGYTIKSSPAINHGSDVITYMTIETEMFPETMVSSDHLTQVIA